MYIQPKIITAPSGAASRPKIITRDYQGKIYTEAHYYDPITGAFFQKGVVSVEDKVTKEKTDINSFK